MAALAPSDKHGGYAGSERLCRSTVYVLDALSVQERNRSIPATLCFPLFAERRGAKPLAA